MNKINDKHIVYWIEEIGRRNYIKVGVTTIRNYKKRIRSLKNTNDKKYRDIAIIHQKTRKEAISLENFFRSRFKNFLSQKNSNFSRPQGGMDFFDGWRMKQELLDYLAENFKKY